MNINKKPYIKFYQDFNKLCLKFDEIPDIEFEKTPSRYPSIKSPQPQPSVHSPKLQFIISELKKRISSSSSNKSPISANINRLKIRTQTEEKIGPGSYFLKSNEKPETHQFSTIPRLKTPITHNILNIESLYSNKEQISKTIVLKNKVLNNYAKELSSKRQSYFDFEKNKEETIREKKRLIDLKNKEDKIKKIKRKDYLFELRMMKFEITSIQKVWNLLLVVSTVVTRLKAKIKLKKVLKSRWEVFLRHFVVISKWLAKFMKKLKIIRKKILVRNLTQLHLPVVGFIKKCIMDKKKELQFLLIEFSELPLFSRIMVKVKFCLVKLQRNIRDYLKIKKARMLALRKLWGKLYIEYVNRNPDKSGPLTRIGAIEPKSIDKYTVKYIYKTKISYLNRLQEFTQKFQEFYSMTNTIMFRMQKPNFLLYTNKEPIIDIIHQAIKFKDLIQKKQRFKKYYKKSVSKSP